VRSLLHWSSLPSSLASANASLHMCDMLPMRTLCSQISSRSCSTATCHIARSRPPLAGLAARLGGRSCRGRGGTRRVGSSAVSAA